MIDELERELRQALAARAAEVPAGAAERLRGRDYRPRTRDVRAGAAAGTLAAAAVAAGVLLIGLGPRATVAFAGWSPTPTAPASGQTSAADASCRGRLAAGLKTPPPGQAAGPAFPATGDLRPVLTDTRGPFTFVIFANDTSSASCITGPGFTSLSASGSSAPTAPPAGTVTVTVSDTAQDGHRYAFAEGHAGAGVTGAALVLADGTHVQATIANGWFVAWWPGGGKVVAADVTTDRGTATQRLDIPPAPSCPQGATCSSGSVGGAGAAHAGRGATVRIQSGG